MVTTPDPSSSRSPGPLLPLLGLVLALAIASGVWFLPKDMVDPEANAIRLRPSPQGSSGPVEWTPIASQNWTELIEGVDRLREPAREEVVPDDPPPIDPPGGDTPPPQDKPDRPPWSFEGLIREPAGVVAVIRTQNGQRLVYVGDTIRFNERRNKTVEWTVASADEERLVLRFGEFDYEYQMLRVAPPRVPGQSLRGPTRTDDGPRPATPPREVGGS